MVRDGWRRKPFSGGAQVTAETMPYHRRWRPECNTGWSHPFRRVIAHADEGDRGPLVPTQRRWDPRSRGNGRRPARYEPSAWNTWSEPPVSRISIVSSPSAAVTFVTTMTRARSTQRTCSVSSYTCRRRASSSRSRSEPSSAGPSWPFDHRSVPVASSEPSICWSSIPTTMPIGSPVPSSRRSSDRPGTRVAPRSTRPDRTTRWLSAAGLRWGSSQPVRGSNDPWPRWAPPRAAHRSSACRAARPRRRGIKTNGPKE